jgi:retron-type reverse transcriptase
LESHLSLNNLHEEHQFAYRKFHSTETALLKVQNNILNSLDRNDVTMSVMLDLSAAFDTIDQTTLLHRLQHHFGIAGKPLEFE